MTAPTLYRIPAPELRGANLALGACRDMEVCLDGPAGTGKTFAALYKLHTTLLANRGARALLSRKSNTALSGSAVATYREMLDDHEGVHYFGGNKVKPAAFEYPNGSLLVVNGLDRPSKVKSWEFDIAFINEATEVTVEDWEFVRTRLRYGHTPYPQLIGDVNPEAPSHWLNQRMIAGLTTRLLSRHEDNPRFYDAARQEWTEDGTRYIFGNLAGLTGVRLARFRHGMWVAAEGAVYQDSWDRARNVVDRQTVCAKGADLYGDCGIPRQWPRYLGVDFGYTHPFVLSWWAEDPDGRLYRYRELYRTHGLVEDHAAVALRWMGYELVEGRARPKGDRADVLPYAIFCDHDAEDRYTLERHLGMPTQPAYKAVADGIQAVAARMRPAGDGKPRLVLLRDSLIDRDAALADAKQPTCTEDEVESYVWNLAGGRNRGEEPVKEHDHGLDAARYVVATRDRRDQEVSYIRGIW